MAGLRMGVCVFTARFIQFDSFCRSRNLLKLFYIKLRSECAATLQIAAEDEGVLQVDKKGELLQGEQIVQTYGAYKMTQFAADAITHRRTFAYEINYVISFCNWHIYS